MYGRLAATGVGGSLSMLPYHFNEFPVLTTLAVIVACTTLFAAALAVRNLVGLFWS